MIMCKMYIITNIAGLTYNLDLMPCYFISVRSRMATGYDAQGNEAFFYNLGWVAPAGQMYSTVNDLMKVTS